MQQDPHHNQPEFTVSEISGAIKRVIEGNFSYVRVRGEISGLSLPKSGHVYFSLKDENSVLKAVCWKGVAGRLNLRPEDGLEVIATGKVTTYGGASNYQLVVDSLEIAGVGALMQLLEKRKQEMAGKGLFDPARKKAIPQFPQTIGVVTSPSGAVIRDILHRLRERFPCRVLLAPVKVQGQGAAEEIASAIRGFNALDEKPDVLIVARGGGSLEDLWCFNEEIVVYAVAESQIPIISAVGHETDTTLIDYAADLRAPTPTGAAEFATPFTISDLRYTISDHGNRIGQNVNKLLERYAREIEGLRRGLPKLDEIVGNYSQRLDDWSERLNNALPSLLEKLRNRLTTLTLRPQILLKDVDAHSKQLLNTGERLTNAYKNKLSTFDLRLSTAAKLLSSLNYKNVLARGFALVKTSDGNLITTAQNSQNEMIIEFADGEIGVKKNG
jgi:exodeoxyribonuclease VII large subunit